jgi:Lar family restriction alleviation protein
MTDPLLPCPFCGESQFTLQEDDAKFPQYRCENCGARGPCIDLDKRELRARWNRRAATQTAPAK